MRMLPFYFLFLFADLANAQTQWGNLKAGPYAVGYKTIQTVDYSRKYFDKGRPLQIYMLYPSSDSLSGEPMVYGSYFEDAGKDWGSAGTTEVLRRSIDEQFKSSALNPSFPGAISDEQVKAIKQTPIPARRNANEAEGNFPLVIHLHVQGALTQSIMLEYLASHGYVVMSISMLGSSPAYFGRGEGSAKEMLDLTEDLAFVLAQARQQPIADTKNVAVIGMMAQVGLSLQFKATPLRAIACLDCFWSTEVLSTLPFYDPKLARIPILEWVNTEFASQKGTYLDSLHYSDRYIGRFRSFPHADFYPFPKIARPALSADFTNYELVLELTLSFLNASIKKETDAIAYLQAISRGEGLPQEVLSVTKTEGKAPIPSEHEFLAWLRYGEMGKARIAWRQYGSSLASQNAMFTATLFLARDRENQAFEVFEMYISGYPPNPRNQMLFGHLNNFLLEIKDLEKAEKVCQAWTKQFPESWEAWMSWGRALREVGERMEAKSAFENALELVQKSTLPTDEKERLINEAKGGP